MQKKLIVAPSPFLRDQSASTRRIMLDVIIAMLPTAFAAVWYFGAPALSVMITCVIGCVASEWAYQKMTHQTSTIGDLSAVVTGLLLAFNMPASAPWWMGLIGSVIAIVLVKQMFGGIGQNFINPALAARTILMLSWTVLMAANVMPQAGQIFGIDLSTKAVTATPVAIVETVETTTEATGAATGETAVDAAPAVAAEATTEATGAATGETAVEAAPAVTAEATTEATGAATGDATVEAAPAVAAEATTEATGAATGETAVEAAPAVTAEATTEATGAATGETAVEAAPAVAAEAIKYGIITHALAGGRGAADHEGQIGAKEALVPALSPRQLPLGHAAHSKAEQGLTIFILALKEAAAKAGRCCTADLLDQLVLRRAALAASRLIKTAVRTGSGLVHIDIVRNCHR